MKRACDQCGNTFIAKSETAKFCSGACRQKAARQRRKAIPGAAGSTSEAVTAPVTLFGSVSKAARAELEAAGVADTALGLQVVALARKLDGNELSGAAYASVSREFRTMLPQVLQTGKVEADPLDELSRRRRERHAGA